MSNDELNQLRVQLAGCGVAALQNTPKSARDRVEPGAYGWSASYANVCRAVDREMIYRDALELIHKIALRDENTPVAGICSAALERARQ